MDSRAKADWRARLEEPFEDFFIRKIVRIQANVPNAAIDVPESHEPHRAILGLLRGDSAVRSVNTHTHTTGLRRDEVENFLHLGQGGRVQLARSQKTATRGGRAAAIGDVVRRWRTAAPAGEYDGEPERG